MAPDPLGATIFRAKKEETMPGITIIKCRCGKIPQIGEVNGPESGIRGWPFVSCPECGAYGAPAPTSAEAVENWNRGREAVSALEVTVSIVDPETGGITDCPPPHTAEPGLRDLAWAELCAERDRYRDRCRAAEADLLALLGGVPSMIAPGEWRRWEALRDGLLWKGDL